MPPYSDIMMTDICVYLIWRYEASDNRKSKQDLGDRMDQQQH